MVLLTPHHRDLIRVLAGRRFTERFKGTTFGWLWLVLNPLLSIALLSFVFGMLLDVRWNLEPPAPYPVALFAGLIVHFFLSECLTKAPGLVSERPEFVHKLKFPLAIVGAVNVIDVTAAFLIALVIFLVVAALAGFTPGFAWLALPLAVLPLIGYGLALSWGLSALGVYVRDLGQIAAQVSTGLLLFSPILYPLSSVPAALRPYYFLNPATAVVENLRTIVFAGALPSAPTLVWPLVISATLATAAFALFRKLERGFADVV